MSGEGSSGDTRSSPAGAAVKADGPSSGRWAAPIVVAIITLAAFLRCIGFDFVWDDWIVLVNNPRLNPPTWSGLGYYWTHIAWKLYMPVTCDVWALLARLAYLPQADSSGSHLNPAIFHLANLLLHVAVALTVYRLLLRAVCRPWPAAGGALLFALHPIQVEPVCFVGAINNMLFAGFSLLAVADYLDAVGPAARKRRYWRGLVLLLLALLCKPTAAVVPLIAAVMDLAIYRRPLSSVVKSVLPWLAVAVPFVIWTASIQGDATAVSPMVAFRPIIAADAMAVYVFKIFVPLRFAIDYGRTPQFLHAHLWMAADGLLPVAMVVIAWLIRRKTPLLSAAIGVFVLALLPNSGLAPFDFQQYSTVADRYAYLTMLGPALAAAFVLSQPMRGARLVAIAVIAGLIFLAVNQSQYWQNDRTLYAHAVAVNPRSWMSHENLAYALPPNDPERIIELRAALRLEPTELHPRMLLANALDAMGDKEGAIEQYDIYLRLDPDNAAMHANLAAVLAETGRLRQAIEHYQRALQIDPNLEAARVGLEMAQRQMNGATHGIH